MAKGWYNDTRGMEVEIIKRSIVLPDEMYAKLEAIAKEQGISVAAAIKIACSEYIKKMGK